MLISKKFIYGVKLKKDKQYQLEDLMETKNFFTEKQQ